MGVFTLSIVYVHNSHIFLESNIAKKKHQKKKMADFLGSTMVRTGPTYSSKRGVSHGITHILPMDKTDVLSRGEGLLTFAYNNQHLLPEKYRLSAPEYSKGEEIYISWFQDQVKNSPKLLDIFFFNQWLRILSEDPFTRHCTRVAVDSTELQVVWTEFIINREIAPLAVEGTPAQILSSTTQNGILHLKYFAQGDKFDMYALPTPEGRAKYERQVRNRHANLMAAVTHNICKSAIPQSLSHYLTPRKITSGTRLPQTVLEALEVMALTFNGFGKTNLSYESLIAHYCEPLIREGRNASVLVLPVASRGTLIQGRRARYIYAESGSNAKNNLANDTSAGMETGTESIAGLKVITMPLHEVNADILRDDCTTGSQFIFHKEFADSTTPDKFKSAWDLVSTCDWASNTWSDYHWAKIVGKEPRFIPGTIEGNTTTYRGNQGTINRELLTSFYGRAMTDDQYRFFQENNDSSKDDFEAAVNGLDQKIKDAKTDQSLEAHFVRCNTKNPKTVDQFNRIDPLMVYQPHKKILYPATFIGELPEAQNPDSTYLMAYKTLALRLKEGLSKDDLEDPYESGGELKKSVWNNAQRCMFGNSLAFNAPTKVISSTAKELGADTNAWNYTGGPKNPKKKSGDDSYSEFAHRINVETFLKGLKDSGEQVTNEAHVLVNSIASSEVFPPFGPNEEIDEEDSKIYGLSDMARRWQQTEIFPDEFMKIAARLYLMQPICPQFFERCAQNNVFSPHSGVVLRVSEKSKMITPVLAEDGQFMEMYYHAMPDKIYGSGENKTGMGESGLFTAARVKDAKSILPLMFAIGGELSQQNGGCGSGFMTDLLKFPEDDQEDESGEQMIPRVIIDMKDPVLDAWRRRYLNCPEQCGRNTNLFFFQGSKVGQGHFPRAIDITGHHRRELFAPYMLESKDYQELDEQLYPGAAFNNWFLNADNAYRTKRAKVPENPPDCFSYEDIRHLHSNNTLAARVETRCIDFRGNLVIKKGCHLRGDRLPGMVEMDQCQVSSS